MSLANKVLGKFNEKKISEGIDAEMLIELMKEYSNAIDSTSSELKKYSKGKFERRMGDYANDEKALKKIGETIITATSNVEDDLAKIKKVVG